MSTLLLDAAPQPKVAGIRSPGDESTPNKSSIFASKGCPRVNAI
jgi:hypothetical protein